MGAHIGAEGQEDHSNEEWLPSLELELSAEEKQSQPGLFSPLQIFLVILIFMMAFQLFQLLLALITTEGTDNTTNRQTATNGSLNETCSEDCIFPFYYDDFYNSCAQFEEIPNLTVCPIYPSVNKTAGFNDYDFGSFSLTQEFCLNAAGEWGPGNVCLPNSSPVPAFAICNNDCPDGKILLKIIKMISSGFLDILARLAAALGIGLVAATAIGGLGALSATGTFGQ